jgi:hypothetical protein
MKTFCVSLLLCCNALSQATEVTPVEKVITLLEDLKGEVEDEGKAEASTYDAFACFCKDKTKEKSDNIKQEQDDWDGYSATFDEQTALSAKLAHEMEETQENIKKLTEEIATTEKMRNAEVETYEINAADLGHGVASLEGAMSDMEAGKGALLQTKKTIRKAAVLADALNLSPKHQRAITALLQSDSDDAPEGEFEFHSDDIMQTIEDLKKQFQDKKDTVESEEGQNKKDYQETLKNLKQDKKDAEATLETKTGEKEDADKEVAKAQENMDLTAAALADDKLYLKDLTMKCELKAREYDQQSKMRADEITALEAAMKIIKEKVKDNESANKRAALVQAPKEDSFVDIAAEELEEAKEEDSMDDVSFFQVSNPRSRIRMLMQQTSKDLSAHKLQEQVIASLLEKGKKIGSPALTAIALRMSADPFVKVKKLIQDLIQRLVQEAADEATKKGWCDTEMGKATKTRDQNFDKTVALNANIMSLEAQKASLEEEISTLTIELADLNDSLTKTTKFRSDEKAENEDTISKADAGLAATKDAYEVLEEFYKKSAKATAELVQIRKVTLLQERSKASPIDEDAPDSGMGGAYKGNQQKAGGILAMLDVIISDFERTLKVTKEDEKQAVAEFASFSKATKTSIGSKESQKTNAESMLKSTDNQITEDMSSLEKHVKMLDDTLKELEDLKPACVDTGMSYEERVQKRKDEIEALKKALCELDPDKVEDECK